MPNNIVAARVARQGGDPGDIREMILEMLRWGCTRSTAAKAAGISKTTFYEWMKLSDFSDAVVKAEGECLALMTRTVVTAAIVRQNPAFALEFLKRRDRAEWGDKIMVEETAAPAEKPDLSALDDEELATLERLLEKTKGTPE